jgi:negative regulator of replication initiation
MKTIKISQAVWDAIANKGKFGETENDVLERIFEIKKEETVMIPHCQNSYQRKPFATRKMSADIHNNLLSIQFQDGPSKNWKLPAPNEKSEIRKILNSALEFASENKASFGQQQAVRKALTNAGYWLSK